MSTGDRARFKLNGALGTIHRATRYGDVTVYSFVFDQPDADGTSLAICGERDLEPP
jgi:hypothetical protein